MKNMNKKGFTIVELVIVIAVIAILAAVLIPTFAGIVANANESAALQEVNAAYKTYMADALLDDDANTPAKKIKLTYKDEYKVVIVDGVAEVVDDFPTGTDYVEMEVTTLENGDKSLAVVTGEDTSSSSSESV